MRTLGLLLGLALLGALRAEAGSLGALGLDESKVTTHSTIHRGEGRVGAGPLVTRLATGEVFWCWGQLGTPRPPPAPLSQPGEGGHPAPAQVPQQGFWCQRGRGCPMASRCPGSVSSRRGQPPPAPLRSPPALADSLQGYGMSLLGHPASRSASKRRTL